MGPSMLDTLACILSDLADAQRSEEYSSKPAENALSNTGNNDGAKASSPIGAALAVVVRRRLRPYRTCGDGRLCLASL